MSSSSTSRTSTTAEWFRLQSSLRELRYTAAEATTDAERDDARRALAEARAAIAEIEKRRTKAIGVADQSKVLCHHLPPLPPKTYAVDPGLHMERASRPRLTPPLPPPAFAVRRSQQDHRTVLKGHPPPLPPPTYVLR